MRVDQEQCRRAHQREREQRNLGYLPAIAGTVASRPKFFQFGKHRTSFIQGRNFRLCFEAEMIRILSLVHHPTVDRVGAARLSSLQS
jgi:hypothetical protein